MVTWVIGSAGLGASAVTVTGWAAATGGGMAEAGGSTTGTGAAALGGATGAGGSMMRGAAGAGAAEMRGGVGAGVTMTMGAGWAMPSPAARARTLGPVPGRQALGAGWRVGAASLRMRSTRLNVSDSARS